MLTKQETLRKVIHISSIFVIFSDVFISHVFTIYSLFFMVLLYSASEFLRHKGMNIPIIPDITNYCSYNHEKKSFVYSPIIFASSILILIAFFEKTPAYTGIIALSLGDGVSGLIGKQFGKTRIFYNEKKTLEGSVGMFFVVFLSLLIFLQDFFLSLTVALVATIVESLSNEAIDNLTVPFVAALMVIFLRSTTPL